MYYEERITKISKQGEASARRHRTTCAIVFFSSLVLFFVWYLLCNPAQREESLKHCKMDTLVACLMNVQLAVIVISFSLMCLITATLALDHEVFIEGRTVNPFAHIFVIISSGGVLFGGYMVCLMAYNLVMPSVFSGSDHWIRMDTTFQSVDDGSRLTFTKHTKEQFEFEDDPGSIRVPKAGDIIRTKELISVTTPIPNGRPDNYSYSEWKHYETNFRIEPQTRLRVVEVKWSQRPSGHVDRPLDYSKLREEKRSEYEIQRLEKLRREDDLLQSRPYYQIFIRYERLPWAWING